VWRSRAGGDTQQRVVAKARTLLVRTNEDNNENPKIPRYKSVNQVLHGQTSEAGTVEPFRSKQSALADCASETIQRHTLEVRLREYNNLNEEWQSRFRYSLWKC